jgi:hypothetical protein
MLTDVGARQCDKRPISPKSSGRAAKNPLRFLKNDLADEHQHKRGGRERTDGEKNFA